MDFIPIYVCEEELLGSRRIWSAFMGPGVQIYNGDRIAEKKFGPPIFFPPLLRN